MQFVSWQICQEMAWNVGDCLTERGLWIGLARDLRAASGS